MKVKMQVANVDRREGTKGTYYKVRIIEALGSDPAGTLATVFDMGIKEEEANNFAGRLGQVFDLQVLSISPPKFGSGNLEITGTYVFEGGVSGRADEIPMEPKSGDTEKDGKGKK